MQLVHAAEDGVALQRRGARQRLRRRDRQAQGQPLRGRPALAVVAQGQADARARISSSAATPRARARARRSARCWSATGTTASCATRRTSARASTSARSRRSRRGWSRCRRKTCPFAEKPELQRADDLGRARARRRSELPELDRRRSPARAGVPAAARRHRSEVGAARRAQPAPRDRGRARRRPDRRRRARSSRARRPRSRSRSARTGSGSRISIASTGRRIRRCKQPALTKRDLLRYLAQVSPYMLPHLADRPLTMIRMPDGIRGQRFFQKHWEQERPEFVETITVFSGHKDEQHDYLLCNNLPTLLWLAQSGTLEFHVWHSRAKLGPDAVTQEHRLRELARGARSARCSTIPTTCCSTSIRTSIPGKEAKGAEPELNTVAFEKGKEVAFWLRELLQSMSLEPIVKTSGKTGLHVFVPIRRTHRLRRRAPRVRAGRPAPDAPAPEGHHAGVERAQAHRQDLHGLQHERPRQDAERRLFAARRARRAGVDAAHVGRARRARIRSTSRITNAPQRLAADRRPLARRAASASRASKRRSNARADAANCGIH